MLHNFNVGNLADEDSHAVLEKAKEDGKIRYWGLSLNSAAEVEFAATQARAHGLQMEYNLLNQASAEAVRAGA